MQYCYLLNSKEKLRRVKSTVNFRTKLCCISPPWGAEYSNFPPIFFSSSLFTFRPKKMYKKKDLKLEEEDCQNYPKQRQQNNEIEKHKQLNTKSKNFETAPARVNKLCLWLFVLQWIGKSFGIFIALFLGWWILSGIWRLGKNILVHKLAIASQIKPKHKFKCLSIGWSNLAFLCRCGCRSSLNLFFILECIIRHFKRYTNRQIKDRFYLRMQYKIRDNVFLILKF